MMVKGTVETGAGPTVPPLFPFSHHPLAQIPVIFYAVL